MPLKGEVFLDYEERFPKRPSLAQDYDSGVKIAMFSLEGNKAFRVTPDLLCKDFVHDVLKSYYSRRRFGLYGLSWSPVKNAINGNIAIASRKPRNTSILAMRKAQKAVLDRFEGGLGIPPTKYFRAVRGKIHYLICQPSPWWRHSPPLLGLYCSLMRSAHVLDTLLIDQEISSKNAACFLKVKSLGRIATSRMMQADIQNITRLLKSRHFQILLDRGLDTFYPQARLNYGKMDGGPTRFKHCKDSPTLVKFHHFSGFLCWVGNRAPFSRWYKYLK